MARSDKRAARRDAAWAAMAVIFAAVLVLNTLGALWHAIVNGSWSALIELPFGILAFGWLTAGAWRRTSWGRVRPPAA